MNPMRARQALFSVRTVICVFLMMFSVGASAQATITSTGNPQTSALFPVEHGFISLSNGDLHLEIPIGNPPQRGDLSLPAKLVYDSAIWQVANGINGLTWTPESGGWSLQYDRVFSSSANIQSTLCPQNSNETIYTYTNVQWTDNSASTHVFPLKTIELNGCTTSTFVDTPSSASYATDNSGYYGQLNQYNQLTVWDPRGTQVVQTAVPTYGASDAVEIDRNGNYIAYGADGVVAEDSMQHARILETIGSRDSSGNPVTLYLDVPIVQSQTARYTITYETITVNTNFGVPASGFLAGQTGKVAESTASIRVIKSLGLPDGSSYQFAYDQSCAQSGCATSYGLLSGMTLPHLGTVSYSFSSDANAGTTEPARWASSHTGSDGTTSFTYAYEGSYTPTTETGGYSCSKVQNLAKGAVLTTTYIFSSCGGAIQPMKVLLSPTAAPNTVDSFTLYSYDFSHPCQNSVCTGAQWIALTGTTTVLPSTGTTASILAGASGSGLIADAQYSYATPGSGKIASVKQWDYYLGTYPTSLPDSPSGTPTRETDTTFGYTVNHALYPTNLSVNNSSGTVASEIQYGYDDPTRFQASPSGVPNHNNTLAASPRGNVTSIKQIAHGTAPVPSLTTYVNYDDTGAVVSIQDPNSNTSTLGYDSTDTFAQVVTRPKTTGINGTIAHVSSKIYDLNSGQITSSTDENNQTTTYNYDSVGRLWTVSFSNGGSPQTLETITYPSVTETDVSTLQSIQTTGSVFIPSKTLVDGFGRVSQTVKAGVSSETQYDAQGHVYTVTNPHIPTTASPTDGTWTYYYDELGRLNKTTPPSTPSTIYQYTQNTVTITDPLGHQRVQTFDAFGNLSSVTEPDNNNVLDWVTTYTNNGLYLTEIDQKGASGSNSANWRSRTFQYDGYGRLWTETTPEAGTYTYQYDNNGNVKSFQNQNANNNTVTMYYDGLNRITSKQVAGGPTYSYTYDSQDTSGDLYGVGRLTHVSDGVSVGSNFTHDPFGRVSSQTDYRPSACNYLYKTSAQYDFQSNLIALTYPDGRTLNWLYDLFNRQTEEAYVLWKGSQPAQPQVYMGSAQYYPPGELQSVYDGSGVQIQANYNPNLTLSSMSYTLGTKTLLSNSYKWDNGPNLKNVVDAATGRTRQFGYDPLNRINSLTDTGTTSAALNTTLPSIPASSQTYSVDAWGNLQQSGTYNFVQNFGTNNRISAAGYIYDSAGNLTQDGLNNTYTYRADGHQATSNGVSYSYDPLDNRVVKTNGSNRTEYFYWGGSLLATLDNSGNWTDVLYGAHGILGTVAGTPNATPIYRVGDHVDSLALTTDDNGNVLGGATVLPFGQTTSNTAGSTQVFTGDLRDSENGSDTTTFRQYSSAQGRWLSPDPYSGSYNLSDPQSFNRYAYVLNQPSASTDPSGLDNTCTILAGGSGLSASCGGGGNVSGGGGGGDDLGGGGLTLWSSDSGNSSWLSYGGYSSTNYAGFNQLQAYRYNGPASNAASDSNAILDWTHTAFALGGLIPVVGEAFNLANVGLDLARGNYRDLALDSVVLGAGLIPGGSDAVRGAQLLEETAEVAEGGSTVLGAFTNAEQIEAFATNAAMDVGSGSGAVYGTAVHTEFANQLRAVDNPNLLIEESYFGGARATRGTAGSVRLDVVETMGPGGAEVAVYDLKTGSAALTQSRIAQILRVTKWTLPVLEVRP